MKKALSLLLILTLSISLFVPVMAADDADIGKEIIIEAGSPDFATEGSWKGGSSLLTPSGTNTWYSSTEGAAATYTLSVDPGTYEIYYWKIVHKEKNDPAVEASISCNGQTDTKTLDFTKGSSEWVLLGSYYLAGDGTECVRFARTAGTDSDIITRTGAVKLIKKGGEIAGEAVSIDVEAELLNITGVTGDVTISEGRTPTRAEFVKMSLAVMGYDSIAGDGTHMFLDVTSAHPYYGVIAAAIDIGIIHGDGKGYFRPEDPVTYLEAVKILVTALGYGERAEYSGGWSAGYLSVANMLDLTDGVSEDFGSFEATRLLYNALHASAANVSIGDMSFKPMDTSVLEAYHNIGYETGIVNGVSGVSITAAADPGDGMARIGDTLLKDSGSLAANYLGQEVSYYFDLEDDTLLLIEEGGSDVVDIEGTEILSVDVTGSVIEIDYDDGSRTRTIRTSSSPKVIYNGQILTPPYSREDFEIESGLLSFVGTGKSYDILIVNDYEVYVVNSVNRDSETVYPKYRPDRLELGGTDVTEYRLLNDRTGKELTLDSLKEWTVLNVLSKHPSQGGGALTIRVSTRKVTGVVTEFAEDKLVIDGKEYELSSGFVPFAGALASADSSVIGNEVTLYLDMSGYIVGADYPDANSSKYVYAYQLRGEDGLNSGVLIKAFTSEGVWEEMPLASSVYFEGVKMNAEEIAQRDKGLIDVTAFDEKIKVDGEEIFIYAQDIHDNTELIEWSTGWQQSGVSSSVTGPQSQLAYYSRDPGTYVTYSTKNVPQGTYGLYYWSANLTAINPMGVEVTETNGNVDTQYIDEISKTENKTWSFAGNYRLGGGSGSVKFFIPEEGAESGSTGKPVLRTVGIKLGAPILGEQNPADYMYDMALPVAKPIYAERNSKGEIIRINLLDSGSAFAEWRYYTATKAFVDSTSRAKIEFVADNETLVFGIPSDPSDTDGYRIESISSLGNELEYNAQAYELDETLCADVLIMDSERDVTTGSANAALVTRVSQTVNGEGESVRSVTAYQDGSEVKFVGADSDAFYNVASGDVILAQKNKAGETPADSSGYIVLYDNGTTSPGQVNNLQNNYCCVSGTVTEVYNGGNAVKIDIGSENRIYHLQGATVYTYNTARDNAAAAALGDISVGDKIFIRIRRSAAKEIVLYR